MAGEMRGNLVWEGGNWKLWKGEESERGKRTDGNLATARTVAVITREEVPVVTLL